MREHRAHVGAGGGVTEHVRQRFAGARAPPGGERQRAIHELLAAGEQERHVTELARGGPVQQLDRCAGAEEATKPLARAVPVDQEDHARPEQLEEGLQRDIGVRREAADGKVIEILARGAAAARARVLPADPHPGEHPLKEQQPRQVHVRVDDGHRALDDPHHDDVRVGLPDLVLHDQRIAAARGHRREPRMLEAQALGAFDAARERSHQRTIARLDPVGQRPGDRLARQAPRQLVELAMRIHHHEVKAVLVVPPPGRQRGDVPRGDRVAVRVQRLSELAQARVELAGGLHAGRVQGHEHPLHLVERRADEPGRPGDLVEAVLAPRARVHDAIERGVRDAAGQPLLAQVRGVGVTVGGRARALQEREQVLDPVVRRERAADLLGQQQLALAERRDDAVLGHLAPVLLPAGLTLALSAARHIGETPLQHCGKCRTSIPLHAPDPPARARHSLRWSADATRTGARGVCFLVSRRRCRSPTPRRTGRHRRSLAHNR